MNKEEGQATTSTIAKTAQQKKLMILGASYSQLPLIRTAKAMGIKTIVASLPGNYIGLDEADEKCFVDISNPVEVLTAARKHQIDGIVTCCMDTGIKALGYVCENLGISGLSEEAARLSSDKALMKTAFENHGVNTAKFRKIANSVELEKALTELELPVIVKAVDLQGSRGIYIARNQEQVNSGFSKTMEETRADFCIVEEFIDGYEFGAQSYIQDGELLYVLPHGDKTYQSNTAVPIGHHMPLIDNESVIEQAVTQVKLAIEALGLNNCAVNVDLIVKDGKVYVIELTGRIGATCLPDLVNIYYGIDIYRMLIMTAIGESPKELFESRKKVQIPCIAQLLVSEQSGIVKNILNKNQPNEDIIDISFNIKTGSKINKFTNGNDRIGQVIVKGDSLEECTVLLENIIENITIELE